MAVGLAMGLALSSLTALSMAGLVSRCLAPEHSCPLPVIADSCCDGQPLTPATLPVVVEAWSTFSQAHTRVMSWLPEPSAGCTASPLVAATPPRMLRATPPLLPPDQHLTAVLLI